jgi:hypothetical protein
MVDAMPARTRAPLFGYRGEFLCEYLSLTDAPAATKPYREERRE